MAHHEYDPDSGYYRVVFKFVGKRYKRSRTLKIRDERRAEAVCGLIEETIRDIERGVLTIPVGVDPGDFIVSGGKLTGKPDIVVPPEVEPITLGELIARYDACKHGKEESSRATEHTHCKHLLRILGSKAIVEHMHKKNIQDYVNKRASETYRRTGKKTKTPTIKKELGTRNSGR